MDQVTVLRLIRLVTKNGFLKRDKGFDSRVSRWIWALLGRVEDVGIMGSEDVGVVRELGKRAVWVVEGLRESERDRQDMVVEMEETQGDELDEVVEECADIGDAGEEGEDLNGDNPEPNFDEGHTIFKNVSPAASHFGPAPKREELEEGEISDSPESSTNEASAKATADELAAAKARLIDRVSGVECENVSINGTNDTKEEVLSEAGEYQERLSNMRGTLDMIITIVGEIFGQRDLLKYRDLLWELPD
jgi:hypothetical protein